MPRILVLFSTWDGQTKRIAERVAAALSREGHQVTVRPVDATGAGAAIASHDAVIVGAAIRMGKHSQQVVSLVREHRKALEARPNAFFSVCSSAGGPGARPKAAARYIDVFRQRTQWEPSEALSFGGAIRYTRYGFWIKSVIRLIMTITGGDTDTSRDHEYTDWQAVDRFAAAFASRLRVATAA